MGRAGVGRRLINDIRVRQDSWDILIRKGSLENLTEKIDGKRGPRYIRRRMRWSINMLLWLQEKGQHHDGTELLQMAQNRREWQEMISYVLTGFGT